MSIRDLGNITENHIDKAIFEAEQEFAETGKTIGANEAFTELERKYFK